MGTPRYRDPRLIELQLLAELDRPNPEGPGPVHVAPGQSGIDYLTLEAWLALARDLSITTDWTPTKFTRAPDPFPDPEKALKERGVRLVEQLEGSGTPDRVRITHRGRLRLYRLRAELDAGRIRDKFGILWDDRHWETDLQVRLWMKAPKEPVSIIVADLDHFKAVNDQLGHDEGDRGIRLYRTIIRELVADDDGEAYAMGGDEAAVILPGVDGTRANVVAEGIRLAVESTFYTIGRGANGSATLAKQPTASLGVGTFYAVATAAGLRKEVDGLTYEAKRQGRNRVVSKEFS